MGTLVNYTCKSLIKLAPGNSAQMYTYQSYNLQYCFWEK